MALDIHNLQSIASTTDISQLKLTAGNQLQQRNVVKAFFRKVGDAFLGLSQSGRAQLAVRNERLILAMQGAVAASRGSQDETARALSGRLNTVLGRLREAAQPNRQKSMDDMLSSLRAEAGFKELPEAAQRHLENAARNIGAHMGRNRWQGALDAVKNRFYGPHSLADMESGLRQHHITQFSKPTEWNEIYGVKEQRKVYWEPVENNLASYVRSRLNGKDFDMPLLSASFKAVADCILANACQTGLGENAGRALPDKLREAAHGIQNTVAELFSEACRSTHLDPFEQAELRKPIDGLLATFITDEALQLVADNAELRRGISQVFIKDTVRGSVDSINGEAMGPSKTQDVYINALRNAVGAEHDRFLPFITTMLSQSGIDGSALDLQKACGFAEESGDMFQNGLVLDLKGRSNVVQREGNDLVIRHQSRVAYITQDAVRAPIYHVDCTVTMRIHLDQPPATTVEQSTGTAYIPSVTYEGLSLTYGAPEPAQG